MDSLTHIVVGALIGEAYAGKALGRRAMVIGAAAQSLPDIDFVESFWLSPADDLVAHRGITHSFLFAICSTVLLALLLERRHRVYGVPVKKWILFFAVEIFTHLFLDAFNNYGVGWLEPFSHLRVSFNAIFVVDPLFTIWPVIALVIILILGRDHRFGKRIVWSGIMISAIYLGIVLLNKVDVNQAVRKNIQTQHIPAKRFFSTPTAFNSFLWFIVIEVNDGYFAGYRSIFDRDDSVPLHFYPQQRSLLDPVLGQNDVKQLVKFSQGYFTVERQDTVLVFNDLRFGQIMGWDDPDAQFVFHYYINQPKDNLLVVQRGRFTGWNRKTAGSLFRRIRGN